MRFAGVVILCSAVMLTGLMSVNRGLKRAACLKELSVFFAELSAAAGGQVQSMLLALETALAVCEGKPRFIKNILNQYSFGEDLCLSWQNEAENWKNAGVLSSDEKNRLLTFGNVFLSVGSEEFCRRTNEYGYIFSELAKKRVEHNNRNGRLYAGLSVMGAVLLFIMLI